MIRHQCKKFNLPQGIIILLLASYSMIALPLVQAEVVKLNATADIWISDANKKERNKSWGRVKRFKLKSVQEMAVIRFDSDKIIGREILSARLFLHTTQPDNQLRYIRTSTVNQDWKEGNSWFRAGATYNFADHASKKLWAWYGSQFCDVSFSSGHSLTGWAERRKEKNGWISVEVAPELVIAMAIGDSDGIAVMDSGTYNPFNNFIHSRESGRFAPYMLVETGYEINIVPELPIVSASPAHQHADMKSGAIRLSIHNDVSVFYWKIKVNGHLLDRWKVPHPGKGALTEFHISGLPPLSKTEIKVTAVSPSGHTSHPVKLLTKASSGLNNTVKFARLRPPTKGKLPSTGQSIGQSMRVWAFPPLIKLSPLHPKPLHSGIDEGASYGSVNAVWDGNQVNLFGIRGEYVDFQLCVESPRNGLKDFRIAPEPLLGTHASRIEISEIEIYLNWYAKTRQGIWQPAYNVPVDSSEKFSIPDPDRGIRDQTNQTFFIDLYIPKDAVAGTYHGNIKVSAHGIPEVDIPVSLEVHAADMPDKLAFWPEMNAYHIPANVHDYYRLAHLNRCVANFWVFRPKIRGHGNKIQVLWKAYDKLVGPLLSGEAFRKNRRAGHPIECLYLPFLDSWPTHLSRKTYNYDGHWPKRGESLKHLIDHYLKSPYIGDALSQEYKAGFLAAQQQFIEHFHEKGWKKTELQCFFGGKKSHRINHGSNLWWTTDEPYHWGDWLALQFFTGMWAQGRDNMGADKRRWIARADISRPQWQGRVLEGRVNSVYYGRFNNARTYQRCNILREKTGIQIRAYGTANAHDRSNTETVALVLNTWLNGADGFQTWWSTGRKGSLDIQEGTAGNALFVNGERFGLPVVGDMRLKSFRKGEQLVEYLLLLSVKYDLNRLQLKQMVAKVLELNTGVKEGTSVDDAGSLLFGQLKAWQIQGLRREILKLL